LELRVNRVITLKLHSGYITTIIKYPFRTPDDQSLSFFVTHAGQEIVNGS
jgi:hypothetical protein